MGHDGNTRMSYKTHKFALIYATVNKERQCGDIDRYYLVAVWLWDYRGDKDFAMFIT